MIWFIYSSPNPKHIHTSMHNKKKTSNVAYTFFREFVCAWDGTLYTRQRSFWNLYLCQGLLFESPRWWKESTKAWPVTRVSNLGTLPEGSWKAKCGAGTKQDSGPSSCRGQVYSPGHSTGTWLQPREALTLAGTERPGGSQHGWLQWIWRGALNLKGNEEKSLRKYQKARLRKNSVLQWLTQEPMSVPSTTSVFHFLRTDNWNKVRAAM